MKLIIKNSSNARITLDKYNFLYVGIIDEKGEIASFGLTVKDDEIVRKIKSQLNGYIKKKIDKK